MAGCILIDFEKMQVINRSPAYRNQYVHRRDSVSIAMLDDAEIAERVKLGLITADPTAQEEEEYEEEEFEEFEEEDVNTSRDDADSSFEEDEEYVLDDRRKSSVDPSGCKASPEGSSHDNHSWSVMDGKSPDDTAAKQIDFSGVDSSDRRKKRNSRFSSISEVDEDCDDEDSTVNGDDDENMEPFDDSENCEPDMSRSKNKVRL